jgi:hypothetical protein
MDRTAARSLPGLSAEARAQAAQFARLQDVDATCEGDGSFLSLGESIARDILAIETEAAHG